MAKRSAAGKLKDPPHSLEDEPELHVSEAALEDDSESEASDEDVGPVGLSGVEC